MTSSVAKVSLSKRVVLIIVLAAIGTTVLVVQLIYNGIDLPADNSPPVANRPLEPSLADNSPVSADTVSIESANRSSDGAVNKRSLVNAEEEWQQSLHSSNYAEDQLIGYLISKGAEDEALRETYLLQAYGLDSGNLLINYEVMRYCHKNSASSLCDLPYMDMLLEAEKNNGLFDAQRAVVALAKGNTEAAIQLLDESVGKSVFSAHDWRYVELFDNSFQRFGFKRSIVSFSYTVGYNAARVIPNSIWALRENTCNPKIVAAKSELARACNAMWQKLTTETHDRLLKTVALSSHLEFSGKSKQQVSDLTRELMEVEYREDLDRSVELTEESLKLQKSIADDTWFAYLKIYREQGELKAGNWLWEQMLD